MKLRIDDVVVAEVVRDVLVREALGGSRTAFEALVSPEEQVLLTGVAGAVGIAVDLIGIGLFGAVIEGVRD